MGTSRLVAHVVATNSSPPSARELRVALARSLPSFMIPASFVRLTEIPLTSRGKADREALRRSARESLTRETAYVAPRNPTEQAIAEILVDLLGLERVSTTDDLFDLGIDSFSVVDLLARIRNRVGVDLRAGDLVHAPTIAALAERIDKVAAVGRAHDRAALARRNGHAAVSGLARSRSADVPDAASGSPV